MTFVIVIPVLSGLMVLWVYAYATRVKTTSDRSVQYWSEAKRAAEKVIADEAMPAPVVRFVYMVSMTTGCGCYAGMMFFDMVLGRMRRDVKRESSDGEFARAMRGLSHDQRNVIAHFMASALFYDTFHVPVPGIGIFVRRAMWWLAASNDRSTVSADQLKGVTISAKHAAERETRRHPVGATCVPA